MITCFNPLSHRPDPKKAQFEPVRSKTGGRRSSALRRRSDRLFQSTRRGSSTLAYGVYSVESLAAYEAYRKGLSEDPLGREKLTISPSARKFLLRRGPGPSSGSPPVPMRSWSSHDRRHIRSRTRRVAAADEYLDIAASMRAMLEEVDGFISVGSASKASRRPGKLLSLSFFATRSRSPLGGHCFRPTAGPRPKAGASGGKAGRVFPATGGAGCPRAARTTGLHDRADGPCRQPSGATPSTADRRGSGFGHGARGKGWINAAACGQRIPSAGPGSFLRQFRRWQSREFAATRYIS